MTHIPENLRRLVYERAHGHCEYCLIHDDDTYMPHEIDHVYAGKHGGETVESNLCLACFDCNRHKGSDIASIDPDTGEVVALFHPCRERWEDHFRLEGAWIEPLTAKGRVTVRLLQINTQERVLERALLAALGRYGF